jgi:hypothetical protein
MPDPQIEELEVMLKPINVRVEPVQYKVNNTAPTGTDLGPQLYQLWRWSGRDSTRGTLIVTAPIADLKAYILGLVEGIGGALRRW